MAAEGLPTGCACYYVARMEKFVRACVFLVGLAVKAFSLMACFYFGSHAFTGFWGEYRFNPKFLPLTAICAIFGYLMVAPRRWMPARWLRDVSYRRIWCVGLVLAAPLYIGLILYPLSFDSYLWDTWCVRMLPIAAILFAVLETRWGVQDLPEHSDSKLRCVLLPLALWLGLVGTFEHLHDGQRTWSSLILALLAAYWWKQDPSEAPAASRLRVAMLPPAVWLGFIGVTHLLAQDRLVWFYYLLVALVTTGFAFAYWLMLRRGDSAAHARESA